MSYISPRAQIDNGVYFGHNVTIHAGVQISKGVMIEDYCVIGKPSRDQTTAFRQKLKDATGRLGIEDYDEVIDTPTIIAEDVTIQSHSTIYSGVRLAQGVICEDNSTVRWDTSIGAFTKVMVNGFVGSYIKIGEYGRISGLVSNSTTIGNYVTCRGWLIHSYKTFGSSLTVIGPTIQDYAVVGRDATVIDNITIGEYAYVAAAAIVTKNVPPKTLVRGVNEMTPFEEWSGAAVFMASFPGPTDKK